MKNYNEVSDVPHFGKWRAHCSHDRVEHISQPSSKHLGTQMLDSICVEQSKCYKYSLGIPDEEFIRGKVPMTKQEIRILTLAKAAIQPTDNILDVGAGTGSISCEAALQAPEGQVFAIERKDEAIGLIKANAEKFGIENITVLQSEAPAGMEALPELDAAIIGGSGSHLADILDKIDSLLKIGGRIVLNCVTVQTLMQCLEYMRSNEKYKYDTIQVQVNRWEQVGPYDMAKAANPIFIVTCEKIK